MSFIKKGLGGVAEYAVMTPPPPPPPPKRRRVTLERLARARGSLGSLGADAPEMSEAQWRAAMLAQQTAVVQWQERWVKRDELQRWLQLAATLAIPLSAAIWKMIFRAGRGASEKK